MNVRIPPALVYSRDRCGQVAGKLPALPLSAQLEQAKKSAPKEEGASPESKTEPVKAPLPKPNLWATKSWATVLGGASGSSGTTPAEPVASECVPEADSGADGEEQDDEEIGDNDSESDASADDDEDEDDGDDDDATQEDADGADRNSGTEHFTGALEAIEEELRDSCLNDPSDVVQGNTVVSEEQEHIVSGFDEDCGCVGGDHQHEHSTNAASTTSTAEPAQPVAAKPASKLMSSTSEPYHTRMMRPSGLASGNNAESQRLRLEDNGVGWINSSNLMQQKGRNGYTMAPTAKKSANTKPKATEDNSTAASVAPTEDTQSVSVSAAGTSTTTKKKKPKKRPTKVACLTTDFSMQNVMLQMDLRIMSVDGLMIKTARQWVLRCVGCFEVHYDMDRLFCRKCGGHSLSRVAASVDAGGALKLHLKKNYHADLHGTKYSLPAPGKQGRYQGELLLREDQLLQGIWKQKCVKIRKDIKSAFGEDVTSDVGMHINKGQAIKIGLGKRNPNATKGRERRGKSKAHTVK
jgi:rRNA maturation endonuclease Nob1